MRTRQIALALFLTVFLVCAKAQEPIAVVVHANNTTANISMPVLREMFQCERTSWPSGAHLRLFSRGNGSPEHDAMLHFIYRMSAGEYNQLWVLKQVRGETGCKPTELPSKGMTLEALRAYPGAIVLVRMSDVTPEMKVLSVDGKKPGSADYPLR